MYDDYFDSSIEFIYSSFDIVSNNLLEGFSNVNSILKEYDPIKFPMAEAMSQGTDGGSCGGVGT